MAPKSDQHPLAEPSLLMTRPQVARALGVGVTTVWRFSRDAEEGRGNFPKPIRLGRRCTRWKRAEIERWTALMASEHGCSAKLAEEICK